MPKHRPIRRDHAPSRALDIAQNRAARRALAKRGVSQLEGAAVSAADARNARKRAPKIGRAGAPLTRPFHRASRHRG